MSSIAEQLRHSLGSIKSSLEAVAIKCGQAFSDCPEVKAACDAIDEIEKLQAIIPAIESIEARQGVDIGEIAFAVHCETKNPDVTNAVMDIVAPYLRQPQPSQHTKTEEEAVDFYEDVYEQCQELIDPHIKVQRHGGSSCGDDSLCASVVDSLRFLIEFWVKHRALSSQDHIVRKEADNA